MRMMECDAHLDAAILDRHYILDVVIRAKGSVPVSEGLEHDFEMIKRQRAQRRRWILRIHDDLASSRSRSRRRQRRRSLIGPVPHSGKTVLEHRHVVISDG